MWTWEFYGLFFHYAYASWKWYKSRYFAIKFHSQDWVKILTLWFILYTRRQRPSQRTMILPMHNVLAGCHDSDSASHFQLGNERKGSQCSFLFQLESGGGWGFTASNHAAEWSHTHQAKPGCLCTKQALWASASKLLEPPWLVDPH